MGQDPFFLNRGPPLPFPPDAVERTELSSGRLPLPPHERPTPHRGLSPSPPGGPCSESLFVSESRLFLIRNSFSRHGPFFSLTLKPLFCPPNVSRVVYHAPLTTGPPHDPRAHRRGSQLYLDTPARTRVPSAVHGLSPPPQRRTGPLRSQSGRCFRPKTSKTSADSPPGEIKLAKFSEKLRRP